MYVKIKAEGIYLGIIFLETTAQWTAEINWHSSPWNKGAGVTVLNDNKTELFQVIPYHDPQLQYNRISLTDASSISR